MKLPRGCWVQYRELPDLRAKVIAHGWNKGRRIVYLHNGHWCYRDEVIKVVSR
jgi:hypothetical protein